MSVYEYLAREKCLWVVPLFVSVKLNGDGTPLLRLLLRPFERIPLVLQFFGSK